MLFCIREQGMGNEIDAPKVEFRPNEKLLVLLA